MNIRKFFEKKSGSTKVRDDVIRDIRKLIENARFQMFHVDGATVSGEADKWAMRFEASFMEQLAMYIADRDHRIAQTYYKRGQEEPKA